jgi:hypothetical protein
VHFYNFATMLIIYLSPMAQGQWDYVISSDGVNVNHVSQAPAHRLPAGHGEVVAVLPWQMLSWHSVQFPPGTGSRKTAVLHSLLEDSLLQDPSDCLLVTAPGSAAVLRQGGSTLVTTVIDPVQQMRREVQTLRQQAGQLDNSDLESMLLALATHWPEGATPEILDYQRGELRLGGLSDASQKQLAAHNWSADNYQWQMV